MLIFFVAGVQQSTLVTIFVRLQQLEELGFGSLQTYALRHSDIHYIATGEAPTNKDAAAMARIEAATAL
jgi:hypothetical protein